MPKSKSETSGVRFRNAAKGTGEIILYGDVGFDVTAGDFSRDLKGLGNVSVIDLRINSFGGDVFDGVTIYNRLKEHAATVNVYVDGIAASAASVIAMAGDVIKMGEAAFIMIHNAWGATIGDADDHEHTAARLRAVNDQIAGIYRNRTGNDIETIREWMRAETDFNSDDAIAKGFADEAFEGERLAAKFDPERHHFKKKPAALLPERMAKAQYAVTRMRMIAIANARR